MDLDFYKNLLLEEKKKVLDSIDKLRFSLNEVSKCELKEDMDYASVSMNNSRDFLLYQNQKKILEEIEVALKKIENNEYGICEMCDEKIEKERLKVKPFARYCIICKEIIEKGEK